MGEAVIRKQVGVLGATSLVGWCLLPQLTAAGYQVQAFSRQAGMRERNDISRGDVAGDHIHWQQFPLLSCNSTIEGIENGVAIPYWISVSPIWVLPDYFELLEKYGVRRVIVLSSTSRFSKSNSSDLEEQSVAQRLADAEKCVQTWAENHGIEWVILRPTLIYGCGRDKNITEIAGIIYRVGFFPLLGKALGLRQPVHSEDVAGACVAVLNSSSVVNREYNISGGETLTYREMIVRVFVAMERPVRVLPVPLWVFGGVVTLLRLIPRYRLWSTAMVERMNRDLLFDHSDAVHDFNFNPRGFVLTAEDVYQKK